MAGCYHDLSAAHPGLLGEVTNRLEANTIRVSLNYAFLDKSEKIREQHLADLEKQRAEIRQFVYSAKDGPSARP